MRTLKDRGAADVAHGFERKSRTMPMVTVAFRREQLDRIAATALENGTSFAEQVRSLCDRALKSEETAT